MSERVVGLDDDGRDFLDQELQRLLAFGRDVVLPGGGAATLDDHGRPRPRQPLELWITSRMLHTYGLGELVGFAGSRQIAEGCLDGLLRLLADDEYGGWYSKVRPDGSPVEFDKACYDHAFVLLAASTASVTGLPQADELFARARQVMLDRFWDDDAGMCVDSWDRSWTDLAGYRGINANMHSVEAMLATADVTGDRCWARRAARIASRVVEWAAGNEWRIPEHFDAGWTPDLDYNRDRPADPFKPFGATVGHGLEWARLMLQIEATLGDDAPVGLVDAAVELFDRAVADGWAVDGNDGFVYTTDWDGRPVVRARMHWVAAEGIATAAALSRRTGEPKYADWYTTWWNYVQRHLMDLDGGSWWHELDADNTPAAHTWEGKPDLYHVVQLTLLPRLPAAPSLASALAAGLLDS